MLVYRSVPSRPTESRRRFNAGALGLCAGPFLPSYAEASSDTSHIVGHLKLNLLDELLMMRHADAPGYSDPQTMRLDAILGIVANNRLPLVGTGSVNRALEPFGFGQAHGADAKTLLNY